MTSVAAPPTTEPPSNASNEELVRWTISVLNARTVEPLTRVWTEETVERFPQATLRGIREIGAYFEESFAALPDFHMDVVSVVEHGEDVFLQWHLSGTHTGAPFQGIEPTGRRVELDGMDHFVIRDGKIVSNFVVYDQMQFARAVGLMPPDGSLADRGLKGAFGLVTKARRRVGR